MSTSLQTRPRPRPNYLLREQLSLNPQERTWRRIRYEPTAKRWFSELDAIWTMVQWTHRSWSRRN